MYHVNINIWGSMAHRCSKLKFERCAPKSAKYFYFRDTFPTTVVYVIYRKESIDKVLFYIYPFIYSLN